MERNIRFNWEGIIREAKRRRKERGLTQQHLAALAKVGRSTLVRFENEKADITMSSVLRILGVLDMLDRKLEGSLLLKKDGSEAADRFVAMFAPNFGGGGMEPKLFADETSLNAFLESLGVSLEARRYAVTDLEKSGNAMIPRVLLSQAELEGIWPLQFTSGRP
jgi:transcriptional regulator with XRE-family HTH domain